MRRLFSLRTVCIAVVIFSVLSFIGGAYLASPRTASGTDKIVTTQKSGAPITVSDWKTKGSTFSFTTNAQGAGIAETEVPKTVIPEAKAYIERVHVFSGLAGVLIYDRSTDSFFGGDYQRRFGNLSFGGGGFVSTHGIIGLYAKASYMR